MLSTENKERILIAAREKCQITFTFTKGKPIRIIADFSTETLKARRAWDEVFEVLRESIKSRLLYQAKLSFISEGEIKTFHDKQKLK
jgi:hypothetical protein